MALITLDDISSADDAVTAAREVASRRTQWASDTSQAQERLASAVGTAERLREQRAQQEAALASRLAAEAALGGELEALGVSLADARDKAAQALGKAETAMAEALAAAGRYRDAVQGANGRLRVLGLAVEDDATEAEFATGWSHSGGVRLGGEWSNLLDVAALLVQSIDKVAAEQLGPRHGVTRWAKGFLGVYAFHARRDALLDRLKAGRETGRRGSKKAA